MSFRGTFHLWSIALNELDVNLDITFLHFDLDD